MWYYDGDWCQTSTNSQCENKIFDPEEENCTYRKTCKPDFTISFSKHDVVKVIKNLIKMPVKIMGN